MTTRAETGSLLQERRVVEAADECLPGRPGPDLAVALQAEIVVPLRQQLAVDRAVDVVAGRATLAQCLVLEHVRPRLLPVTLRAGLVDPGHPHSLGLVDVLAVGVVAGSAAYLAFLDRVMMLEVELGLLVQVALEAALRILAGDDELAFASTGLDVQAAGAVARFAALALDALAFTGNLNPGVLRELEVFDFLLMAHRALVHADVGRAGNHRGRDDDAVNRRARDDHHGRGDQHNQTGDGGSSRLDGLWIHVMVSGIGG
mgnify:CR=1 FL=1